VRVAGAERPWSEGQRRTLRITVENRGPATWLGAHRGSGGVAIAVRLEGGGGGGGLRDLLADLPWLPLPVDLAAGEAATVELAVRRPAGPARLRVEPRVVGGASFAELGGPVWEEWV
jgi:hypothetical protein